MKTKTLLSFLSTILVSAAPAFAQGYAFTAIDVSCAADAIASSCPAGLAPGAGARQTSAKGINARGDIVGAYNDTANIQHGFLRHDGTFTTIDFPLSGVRSTSANGINAHGEIVGQYVAPINASVPTDSPLYCPNNVAGSADPACIKGFLYRRGHYSTVIFPGHLGAIAQRITADGDIYGCIHDHDLGASMFGSGWIRLPAGKDSAEVQDRFSLASNGGQLSDPMAIPMSMNNGGTPGGGQTVVGFSTDMGGVQHGYAVQDGMLAPYDPALDPAVTTGAVNLTAIWDINPSQQFVGTYRKMGEPAPKRHGLVQSPDEPYAVTVDVGFTDAAGSTTTAFATVVFGINPAGVIVGQYALVSGGALHGFLAVPGGH